MRINVSETTARLLGDRIPLDDRGPVEVKGKGAIRMFFVRQR
jgi:hypothetical protein